MASRREHVYAIKNIINKGPASDDDRLSERLISHMLSTSRSVLLKRKMDKEKQVNDFNYQIICMPLEETNFADCPGCNLPDLDCKLMKSRELVPKSIITRWGMTYRIRKIDGTLLPYYNMTNKKFSKFSLTANNTKTIGWFMQGSRLFVVGSTKLPLVIIEAVFENPEDIENFAACPDNPITITSPCSFLDEEFPIDPDLVFPMYELTIKLLGYTNYFVEDKVNDSSAPKAIPMRQKSNKYDGQGEI